MDGFNIFQDVFMYVVLLISVLLFHAFVTYSLILKFFASINPLHFFYKRNLDVKCVCVFGELFCVTRIFYNIEHCFFSRLYFWLRTYLISCKFKYIYFIEQIIILVIKIIWKQKTPTFLKGFNVAPGGIEPPTQGFSVLCSTDWARSPKSRSNL